jgi:hypothetical protein
VHLCFVPWSSELQSQQRFHHRSLLQVSALCHSFLVYFLNFFIHYDGPFLIFFIACRFVGGLQRDLISGQLYSCPTRYQLSYSTLLTELCRTLNCSPVLHMRVTTELQSQQHFHHWGLLQVKVLVALRPPFLNCLLNFFIHYDGPFFFFFY